MYRLTARRLQNATGILEKYMTILSKKPSFNAMQFEHELRQCWGLGRRELRDIMKDVLKNGRYRNVAIYYIEHGNDTGVVSEFRSLA